jgi:hypothetical protein
MLPGWQRLVFAWAYGQIPGRGVKNYSHLSHGSLQELVFPLMVGDEGVDSVVTYSIARNFKKRESKEI